ncbi:FCD domain-containing protein [Rhizobium laguerreae]|jgi:DNA-binding GntR family transcriptional regulator|uniref:GntR family transcriptional regulator n=1 Tax=Rhizobium TaxID=379 RepID=UPI0014451533|nr:MULTISPECIES: FCD domain-containing protein [Rhizobium]MBY3307653.1 FCD domain-containing protein [Rhizobium laguerreae]NKJ08389.1 DNA-binding GntR family transcriptional regulator [Rhizobium sp. SG741]
MATQPALTQADNVYERLKADILSCRLRPGAKIRINEVARDFEVSLGAVREALSRLAAEDMAVATAQKGFSVPDVSIADLLDLTDTRIKIEELCIRASVKNGDIEWETALVAAFHRLQRLPETETDGGKLILSERWASAHQQFHLAIVAACNSPSLMKIRAVLYAQTERYRRLSVPMRTHDRDVAAEHKAIFDAVIAGDANLAVALMETHLRSTTEILVESLSGVADVQPND